MTNKWVNALHDDAAQVHAIGPCVTMGDLNGDGDVKLIVADMGINRINMRLRIFKGVGVVGESVLAEVPGAVCCFHNEQTTVPSVAIASGHSLLIYKNLKPFYKFTVPGSKVNPIEEEAWQKAGAGEISVNQLNTVLSNLKQEVLLRNLTSTSQTFLLASEDDRVALVHRYGQKTLQNTCSITCLTAIKKNTADVSPIDVLVIGTERGVVHAIDSQAFTVVLTCQLPSTPAFLCTHGVFDVDFRIFVATRDGQIFTVKRDQARVDKPTITMKADILAITKFNKMLAVACVDNTLTFFTFKGKRQNQIKLHSPIRGLEPFSYAPRQYTGVLVALDHQVRIYNDMFQLDQLRVDPKIRWIKYGPFGREEGGLIIGTTEGGIIVKLFRRLAKLDEKIEINQQMHQAYQRDLFMLKYLTTKTFYEMTRSSLNTVAISGDSKEAVDISVEIHGFGPSFRLTVNLNNSSKFPIDEAVISFIYDSTMYRFQHSMINIAYVVPGRSYSYFTGVTCLHPEKGTNSEVRALLCKKDRSNPLVTSIITMPISEMSLLD
ncbi:unnamed protein product, partial [Mesorhabditis spiculigera]